MRRLAPATIVRATLGFPLCLGVVPFAQPSAKAAEQAGNPSAASGSMRVWCVSVLLIWAAFALDTHAVAALTEPWVSASWALRDAAGTAAFDQGSFGNHGEIHRPGRAQSDQGAALRFSPQDDTIVVPITPLGIETVRVSF
jgi:hypothetical protein